MPPRTRIEEPVPVYASTDEGWGTAIANEGGSTVAGLAGSMIVPMAAVDPTGETSLGLLVVPVARCKISRFLCPIQMLEVSDHYRRSYLTSTVRRWQSRAVF